MDIVVIHISYFECLHGNQILVAFRSPKETVLVITPGHGIWSLVPLTLIIDSFFSIFFFLNNIERKKSPEILFYRLIRAKKNTQTNMAFLSQPFYNGLQNLTMHKGKLVCVLNDQQIMRFFFRGYC